MEYPNMNPRLELSAFLKLSLRERSSLLRKNALFLDRDQQGVREMNLYFMKGYFIEECLYEGEIQEIIPFKNGYRLSQFNLQSPASPFTVLP